MEIWLDTSNVDIVANASTLGILEGVTTNPSILSVSKIPPQDVIEQYLEIQPGLVAVQVLADDTDEMCEQAKILASVSERIVVKIPVTQNGIRAISALSQEGILTLATAIFEPRQALLAFKAGAHYLAPYLGRIADMGKDPIEEVWKMESLKLQYGFNGKIMGAGIRDLTTALNCMELGISAMTLTDKVFIEFMQDHEGTMQALEIFSNDWSKSGHCKEEFFLFAESVMS